MTSRSIERILCPTDFSTFSDQALRHALALGQKFKARLKVVHVIPRQFLGVESIYGSALWIPNPEVRRNAEEAMRRFLLPAREARLDHEFEIREGDPCKEVTAAAEDMRSDLVVLGTHGYGGLDRFLLGSVAEKLIRRLPCPVMSVAHEEGRTWSAPGLVTRILCATDFSETSAHALVAAVELARKFGATISLVHVVERFPGDAAMRYGAVDLDGLRRALVTQAADQLDHEVAGADAKGVAIEPRAVIGCAYKEILRIAAQERADLIVIGAQGHGVIEHVLFGSNAQHVIRRASCPVLTVRPVRLEPPAKPASAAVVVRSVAAVASGPEARA